MDLSAFKKLHKRFDKFPLSKQELETSEYEQYQEAIYGSNDCNDWWIKQKLKKAEINHKRFCCLLLSYHLIEDKLRDTECNVDRIITYDKSQKCFGIPIHDGGQSFIKIEYCPWCGKNLSNYPIRRSSR